MALVSPGVQVSVIDESFYTPAEPGTVPMIFVATAQDKTSSSGTGTATGTLAANNGKVYLMTSQRELAETFGDPVFKKDANNNPIHGGELNEYGLQAAYSYLGVANRAYVARAAIDTGQLEASATMATADPESGTSWLDTASTDYGMFSWNSNASSTTGGQTYTKIYPTVLTDTTHLSGGDGSIPKTSFGAVGDYVVDATTSYNDIYFKRYDNTWVNVGTAAWKKSQATVTGTVANPTVTNTGTFVVNGSTVTSGGTDVDAVVTAINAAAITGVTAKAVAGKLEIYSEGTGGGGYADTVVIANGGGNAGLETELGITASTYNLPSANVQAHTSVPNFKNPAGGNSSSTGRPSGSIWIKTTTPNLGANYKIKKFNATTKLWEDLTSPLYSSGNNAIYNLDRVGGGKNLAVGTTYINYDNGTTEIDLRPYRRANTGNTSITSSVIATQVTGGTYAFNIAESIVGQDAMSSASTISVTTTAAATDSDVIAAGINGAGMVNVSATVDSLNRVVISHNDGGEMHITDTGGVLALAGFSSTTTNMEYEPGTDAATNPKQWRASNWTVLTYTASATAPTSLAADGQLWYSSVIDSVDIMEHNGSKWDGYLTVNAGTDPAGPQVKATAPTTQSDATALVEGDIWIDSSDLENYPKINKWNATSLKWVAVDNSDQTTEDGVVFADARSSTAGADTTDATIVALLSSDYVDTDAPDPALYPKGTLLFNLRRSGFNVKKFARNYVDTTANNTRMGDVSMSGYYAHRWVTESANNSDGSGAFGRKSQRKVVVQSLQALVNANQDIRDDESRIFNLVAAPGYPELIGELVSLNTDRGLSAFIVGDAPFRLSSDSTSLSDWATNVNSAVEDNDKGLVTSNDYLGVFYPSGFTSDNFGKNITVPASHMMLRTIALSDQVSYPWFAPAGTRRGTITNASSTGYINSEGEFTASALNEGQRDTLYSNNVNPITFITGAGLVNYGQKTRSGATSSLDRINVSRLVIYIRSQLNKLARPFVFEPNDKITRDEIKAQADSLLLELVGNRALYDFLVVCDESNNTPARIDRNELYLDIAIEPVKAVEFIYIPLRLKNTGEIAGL